MKKLIVCLLAGFVCLLSCRTGKVELLSADGGPSIWVPQSDTIQYGVYWTMGFQIQPEALAEMDNYCQSSNSPVLEFSDKSTMRVLSDFEKPCFPDTLFTYKYKNGKLRLKSESGIKMELPISLLLDNHFDCEINSTEIKMLQFIKKKQWWFDFSVFETSPEIQPSGISVFETSPEIQPSGISGLVVVYDTASVSYLWFFTKDYPVGTFWQGYYYFAAPTMAESMTEGCYPNNPTECIIRGIRPQDWWSYEIYYLICQMRGRLK